MIDVEEEFQSIVDQLNPILKPPFRLHALVQGVQMTIQITGTEEIKFEHGGQKGFCLAEIDIRDNPYKDREFFLECLEIWTPRYSSDLANMLKFAYWDALTDETIEHALRRFWGDYIFLSPLELITEGDG